MNIMISQIQFIPSTLSNHHILWHQQLIVCAVNFKSLVFFFPFQANKVLFLLEACFDLISSPSLSMNIQIMDGKIPEIWDSNPRSGRSKNVYPFFFTFQFFKQNWVPLILTIFWYLGLLFRNQIKYVENICFYWYLIWKTRY